MLKLNIWTLFFFCRPFILCYIPPYSKGVTLNVNIIRLPLTFSPLILSSGPAVTMLQLGIVQIPTLLLYCKGCLNSCSKLTKQAWWITKCSWIICLDNCSLVGITSSFTNTFPREYFFKNNNLNVTCHLLQPSVKTLQRSRVKLLQLATNYIARKLLIFFSLIHRL